MEIILENITNNDKYTQYIYDTYDIQNNEKTTVKINYHLNKLDNFDWNIGIILGNSGSGKTTILKNIGTIKEPIFDENKSLISNFDWLEPQEATFLLTSMGLSSVPTWLRPYSKLSNGEQYRAKLAYLISSSKDTDIVLVDEYTSVVDRDVAKAMSFALQKYIRKSNKKIILASCHYDILEWLMPDWICSPQKGGALEKCDYLRQGRPKIELQVSRVESETWNLFKNHHYLTEKANKANIFLLFEWKDKPVGIVVASRFPSGTIKNGFRLSRTVVLPDYQGMGIGSKISEFVCSIIKGSFNNSQCFTKTVNPALVIYRDNSTNWKQSSKHGRMTRPQTRDKGEHIWNTKTRASYCHEYIGDSLNGFENLLMPINSLRQEKFNKNNLTLF